MSNFDFFWEVVCFHPISSTEKMRFCILFQVYLRIQVSFLSNFDRLPEGQALPYLWGLVALGPVVVVAAWAYFDQLEHCGLQDLNLKLDCRTFSLILNCGTLSLIFNCRTSCLICRTLHHIHKLILSIMINLIRGIWSIHPFSNLLPTQIISECLSHLDFVLFPYIYIKTYILLLYR